MSPSFIPSRSRPFAASQASIRIPIFPAALKPTVRGSSRDVPADCGKPWRQTRSDSRRQPSWFVRPRALCLAAQSRRGCWRCALSGRRSSASAIQSLRAMSHSSAGAARGASPVARQAGRNGHRGWSADFGGGTSDFSVDAVCSLEGGTLHAGTARCHGPCIGKFAGDTLFYYRHRRLTWSPAADMERAASTARFATRCPDESPTLLPSKPVRALGISSR